MLASVAEQDSLSLTWSETPEDTFSHNEVHVYVFKKFAFVFCELNLVKVFFFFFFFKFKNPFKNHHSQQIYTDYCSMTWLLQYDNNLVVGTLLEIQRSVVAFNNFSVTLWSFMIATETAMLIFTVISQKNHNPFYDIPGVNDPKFFGQICLGKQCRPTSDCS